MSDQSLRKKTINGILWNTVEKVLVKGVSFIIGIFLARILSPDDYGLIGMLAIFMSLSGVFIEGGFVKALIQKQDRTETDYSTVFYFNLAVAVALYAILFLTAPLVAAFYDKPPLIVLLRVLSLNIIIGSLNIVQRTKLIIAMDFKTQAKINFFGVAVGGAGGLLMAYSDAGVWALVGQSLISGVVMALMFVFYKKWKPLLVFSGESFKKLFGFGSKLLLTGIYSTVMNNINSLMIGKYHKTDQLGYYTRAVQSTDMIALTASEVIGSVTFPMLSTIQEQRERMISIYSKALSMTAFLIFPVMTLFAVLAKPFILIFLTEKWLPCVILIQILCFARVFTPLSSINMNILNAIGRSDLFLKVDLTKFPMVVIAMIITIPIGAKAIVTGGVITTFIAYFINAYYPGKLFGYGAFSQIRDTGKTIISTVAMAASVMPITSATSNPWIQLIAGGFVGMCVYLLSSRLLKSEELNEIVSSIKKILKH